MLPEQVWDGRPPTGAPVERPAIVACRYTGDCAGAELQAPSPGPTIVIP